VLSEQATKIAAADIRIMARNEIIRSSRIIAHDAYYHVHPGSDRPEDEERGQSGAA
jgi:hypothetical protein